MNDPGFDVRTKFDLFHQSLTTNVYESSSQCDSAECSEDERLW